MSRAKAAGFHLLVVIVVIGLWALLVNPGADYFASAADGNRLLRVEASPSGRLVVEYYSAGPEAYEIRLGAQDQPATAATLYQFKRDTSVLFSPDETWLALTDFIGSNITDVILFKKSADAKFVQASGPAVFDSVKELLHREHPKTKQLALGTFHVRAVRWSTNSKTLLLEVSALADTAERIDGWLCLYDVQRKRALADLSRINQQVFSSPKSR